MRRTTGTRRYRRTVPGVMAALFVVAGVATAGCGSEGASTALPAPGSDAEVEATTQETGAPRGESRPSTTRSPSRTTTTSRGSANRSSGSGDKGKAPSKGGEGAVPGRGSSAGNPSVTNGGPNTTGPDTPRSTTKATAGPTKRSSGNTTTTSGGRTYPGLPEDERGAVVTPSRGPGGGPPILPPETLLAHLDPLYEALPAKSPEVMRQTEDVVRLAREAPPESRQAATGDAAILVAAAEEVSRTGNVAKYEEPQVRAAYQNLKAEQARAPAGGVGAR